MLSSLEIDADEIWNSFVADPSGFATDLDKFIESTSKLAPDVHGQARFRMCSATSLCGDTVMLD